MEEKKRWNIGYYNSIIFKNLMHTIMCNNTQLSNQFYLGIQKNLFSLQAVVSLGKFINHDENSFSLFTQPSFFLRKTITCVGDEEILRFFFLFCQTPVFIFFCCSTLENFPRLLIIFTTLHSLLQFSVRYDRELKFYNLKSFLCE